MGKRRKAREFALQILYRMEINPEELSTVWEIFWEDHSVENGTKEFVRLLVKGTLEKKDEIDRMMQSAVKNWQMDRLSAIDRNIIRMGTYELIFLPQLEPLKECIPCAVTINEAVEIAKKYSTPDSGKFVNGVLDQIRKEFLNGGKSS